MLLQYSFHDYSVADRTVMLAGFDRTWWLGEKGSSPGT